LDFILLVSLWFWFVGLHAKGWVSNTCPVEAAILKLEARSYQTKLGLMTVNYLGFLNSAGELNSIKELADVE